MPNIYSKLLAMGILAALLTAAWLLLGEPYVDLWQDRIAQAERLQRKQLALRQLIGNREYFEQQYAALSDSEGLQQVFLDEKSGALADVKLQRVVKQIVEDQCWCTHVCFIHDSARTSRRVQLYDIPLRRKVV